jgi:hypothetical protein
MAELREEVTWEWAITIMAGAWALGLRGWPWKVPSFWHLLVGRLTRWLERSPISRVSLQLCARPRTQPKRSSWAWLTRQSTPTSDGKRLRGCVIAWPRSLLFYGAEGPSCA